jgi:4-hydroxythreonine-4-phosphate dehydrogenase
MRVLAITTGDLDGIGAEVTVKALAQLGPQAGFRFVVYTHQNFTASYGKWVRTRFNLRKAASLESAIHDPFRTSKDLLIIESPERPQQWVREAAKQAMAKNIHGLVTAPMSKHRGALGHTEILSKVSGHRSLFMAFLGRKVNVVLATGHVPLQRVSKELNSRRLDLCIEETSSLLKSLPKVYRRKGSLGVLGLNPHAGEGGLLGREELSWIAPLIHRRRKGVPLAGPLSPDAAFTPTSLKKFSTLIALYHDQGLIPFKALHGFDEGVHVTLGLPFVRTSVDHGTAKDLFGQNRASAGSMRDALTTAMALARRQT